jgi:hypothetical protein
VNVSHHGQSIRQSRSGKGDAGSRRIGLSYGQAVGRPSGYGLRRKPAYGRWLRRQRRVTQALPPLRSAQITFDLIGACSWAEQARSELRAAGERIQAQEPNAQDVLSA